MRWNHLAAICIGIATSLAIGCGGRGARFRAAPAADGAAAQAHGAADEFDTETYDRIVENEFVDPRDQPLSTFSIDVDTAAYSNVRRFLNEGRLPPPGAVRIEEMVNYFTYSYPEPEGDVPFSVTTEVAACPWNERNRLVQIGLQAHRAPSEDLPPCNLVFLIDVSGSMASEAKLPLVKDALRMLAGRLRAEDSVALAVYAGAAGTVLPPTSGMQRERILDAIDRLHAGGSTNGAEGIRLAYELAQTAFTKVGVNRVILCTDGDFNIGVTSQSELVRMIERERDGGVELTALGFGMGNYKDSTLEKLADHGNGNYAYVDTRSEARRILVTEAAGTLWTIAKDVKVQVEFNPARVAAYRLLGYENRLLAAQDFNDDSKDAGEIGAGHSVTALYEVTPSNAAAEQSGVDPLRYQTGRAPTDASGTAEMLTLKIRYKDPKGSESRLLSTPVIGRDVVMDDASEDFRFAASVVGFGMLLRNSNFRGTADFDMVRRLARSGQGDDRDGHRAEFQMLVAMAADLSAEEPGTTGTK